MLVAYEVKNDSLVMREGKDANPEKAVWIDLLNPSKEEEKAVERALGHGIPTREELHEIEESSRLYQTDSTYIMTATVLYQADQPHPSICHVTFILTGKTLITVRYAEPRAFALFAQKACKADAGGVTTAITIMLGLLEAIVDRLADFIERVQTEVDDLGRVVFEMKGGGATRQRRYDITLRKVGREGEVTSRARESLLSLGRLLAFLEQVFIERKEQKALIGRVHAIDRDVKSLADHVGFVLDKITFLLDATLGMVQIEQNNIVKIVSVAAVVLLPPTLVATIYGMNFRNMPELEWVYGYPMAIGLILLAAILPYLFFRRKGWL